MRNLGLLTVVGLLVSGGASAELRAGVATVSITPLEAGIPTPLGGYGARDGKPAVGVHDTLNAKALVLESGGNPLLCSHGEESGPLAIRFSVERRRQPEPAVWLTVPPAETARAGMAPTPPRYARWGGGGRGQPPGGANQQGGEGGGGLRQGQFPKQGPGVRAHGDQDVRAPAVRGAGDPQRP